MPVLTAAIALLVSVASFVFAALVFAENRRLEREKHRAVALSSTHTASLLLHNQPGVRRLRALTQPKLLALIDPKIHLRLRTEVAQCHHRTPRLTDEESGH